jgi:hypothetical protein
MLGCGWVCDGCDLIVVGEGEVEGDNDVMTCDDDGCNETA